jgi:hypothetical protein
MTESSMNTKLVANTDGYTNSSHRFALCHTPMLDLPYYCHHIVQNRADCASIWLHYFSRPPVPSVDHRRRYHALDNVPNCHVLDPWSSIQNSQLIEKKNSARAASKVSR